MGKWLVKSKVQGRLFQVREVKKKKNIYCETCRNSLFLDVRK